MRAVRDARPRFPPSRLAVLLLLAIRMDEHGRGYVTHEQLAEDAGTCERTARRATAEARRRGYLVQLRQGHRITEATAIASEWALTQPDSSVRLEATQPDTGDRLARTQPDFLATQPDTGDRLEPTQPDTICPAITPLIEIRPSPRAPHTYGAADAAPESEFDEFWRAYPRAIAPAQARRAWKAAVKKADPATIIAAAKAFADWHAVEGTEERFIPYPSTWLNGERWADELPPHRRNTNGHRAYKNPTTDDAYTEGL